MNRLLHILFGVFLLCWFVIAIGSLFRNKSALDFLGTATVLTAFVGIALGLFNPKG